MESVNEYGWFVHPFDAGQWVYKKLDANYVHGLAQDHKINLGMVNNSANLIIDGSLSFDKRMGIEFNGLLSSIIVPNEVSLKEAIIYNFGCKLDDNLFVLKQFDLDELLFKNALSDDEINLDKNKFINNLNDMKDNKIYPSDYIEEDDEEDE